jgi:hypothetical protein
LFIFVEKTGSTSNKLGKTKLKTEDGSFWNCSFTLGMIAFYSVLFLALNKFYFKLPLPSFNLDEISIKKQISLVFGFVFFAMPFFSSFSKEWAILYHFKMTENVKWQKKMEKRSWFVRPKITPGITQGETFEVNLILLYFTNIIECVLHLLSFVLCKKTDN